VGSTCRWPFAIVNVKYESGDPVRNELQIAMIAHEIGHNLGMMNIQRNALRIRLLSWLETQVILHLIN
jgi:hypothetical protein